MPTRPTSFHSWALLPPELQLNILGQLLTSAEPISRLKNSMSFMENEISDIIRANNRHLVQVALEACKYTSFSSYISLYTLKTHRSAE